VGAFAALGLIVWVYLLALHGRFWRTTERLPTAVVPPRPADWPAVTAVIPSRNEGASLPLTLPTLLAQDYPGEFTVVVVDDGSTDDTAAVAKDLGATVITGTSREPGWAGKVHAMAQGLARATTEYVLFTDADIAWKPGALRELVSSAVASRKALVSQMVLLRTRTESERALVPAFVYFFAQLYPFHRVNRQSGRTAAAAGGCMLVRREALCDAGGLEPIKGALIDDVALGTLLKRAGHDIWLGLTTVITSERPYPRPKDLWHMVARSAYTQLNYNPLILAGTVAGLALIYLVPPAAAIAGAVTGDALATWAGAAAWLLISVSYIPMLRFYRLSPLRAPLLPLVALAYTAMTLDSARRHYTRTPVPWRAPPTPPLSPGTPPTRDPAHPETF
jgi:hopene-associated glycosyltransferase HpnB